MPPVPFAARAALALFVLVTLVHVAAQLRMATSVMAWSQVLLVPPLFAALWLSTKAPRSTTTRFALVALVWSWLGDTAPRALGDGAPTASFLLMMGLSLVAQLCFARAFWPHRAQSVLGDRPRLLLVLALAVGLGAFGAGVLRDPLAGAVVVYAAAILAMAALATGLGVFGTLGGLLFVVSDGLIALRTFGGITVPGDGAVVMATYAAALALLVHAVVVEALREV
jgi:uncharacterized membrane protein YhhN